MDRTIEGPQRGLMPWRLQIAARLMAGAAAHPDHEGVDEDDERVYLYAADALIAAHEATKGGCDGEE